MADEFEDQTQGNDANADGSADELAQLDSLIAADEAAEAAQKQAAGDQAARRNTKGQFTSAQDAQRAGQRQTPAEISAADAKAKAGAPAAKAKAEATQTVQTPEQPEKKDGDTSPRPSPQSGAGEDKGDAGKSRYEKAKEREAKSWTEINKAKDEQAAKAAELDLREKAIAAREQGRRGAPALPEGEPKWQGFTAAQMRAGALDYEARGEFDLADEARKIAAQLEQAGRPAGQAGNGHGNGNGNGHGPNLTAGWQRLRGDLPELFNPSSRLNAEMRALLETEPGLLEDDAGPYRAAIKTGRKAIARLEQEIARHRTEAAQVPGLQQKVSELSARVKELEAATSITDGGGAMNRGGGGEKPFAELSTQEMSDRLDREFATALGG